MRKFVLTIALAATPLTAQPQSKSVALEPLRDCRAIAEAGARLACYDREADALLAASARNEVVVMDKTDIRTTRRSLFGFALPNIGIFKSRDEADARDNDIIVARVNGLRSLGYDKYQFTIDDGAVWQTTEFAATPPRNGGSVSIKRGAMGSYLARFDNGRVVRVMRTK